MTARVLDRTRSYGQVYGLTGVQFEQDGISFNAVGIEVDPSAFPRINDEPEKPPERDDTPIHPAIVITDDKPPRDESTDLSQKHWKHLKVMVEAYGGEWTSKEDAINFLRGKKI